MTAENLRTGKEYDASLIWTEDPNKDSFKVCLREMQNFDGKHEAITVVCLKIISLLKAEKDIDAMGEVVTSEKAGRFQCSYDVTRTGYCTNEYKQENERYNLNCH